MAYSIKENEGASLPLHLYCQISNTKNGTPAPAAAVASTAWVKVTFKRVSASMLAEIIASVSSVSSQQSLSAAPINY
jgi:uncharacterized protein YgiM (DUF1202 family)